MTQKANKPGTIATTALLSGLLGLGASDYVVPTTQTVEPEVIEVASEPIVQQVTKEVRFEELHHRADRSVTIALSLSRSTTNEELVALFKKQQQRIEADKKLKRQAAERITFLENKLTQPSAVEFYHRQKKLNSLEKHR